MRVMFRKANPQGKSPLFSLPTEIRRLIYLNLFGSRRVHVRLCKYVRLGAFSREDCPRKPYSSLYHCLCRKSALVPDDHEEYTHKWCYLSTNFIFTCKYAYEEGVRILYQTNTFIFQDVYEWSTFVARSPRNIRLMRAVDFVLSTSPYEVAFDLGTISKSLLYNLPRDRPYPAQIRFLLMEEYEPLDHDRNGETGDIYNRQIASIMTPIRHLMFGVNRGPFSVELMLPSSSKEALTNSLQREFEKFQSTRRTVQPPTVSFVDDPYSFSMVREGSDHSDFGFQIFDDSNEESD